MKQLDFKLTGTSPLLLSCDRLADPLDPLAIEHSRLNKKKNKTIEDHMAVAKSQWRGLLYLNEKEEVIVPTQNIRACLIRGGTMAKLGTALKRGTLALDEHALLDYGKKLSVEQLWEQGFLDRRTVIISGRRVVAYRPCFKQWSLKSSILYDENILDAHQIVSSLENAGRYVGLGGYRPERGGMFGRFGVEIVS